jgi:hypothetical protein
MSTDVNTPIGPQSNGMNPRNPDLSIIIQLYCGHNWRALRENKQRTDSAACGLFQALIYATPSTFKATDVTDVRALASWAKLQGD